MTDIMKLIDDVIDYNASDERPRAALQSAIEALQGECAEHKENAIRNARQAVAFRAERDALQAKLDELQWQEPLPAGLERCEFDDECDYCDSPEQGTYTRLIHNPEDCTEAEFYICGGCLAGAIPPKAAPKALEPLTDEQIADSILAADRAQWLADNFDSSHEHYNEALDKLRAYAKLIRDLLVAHGITKGTP